MDRDPPEGAPVPVPPAPPPATYPPPPPPAPPVTSTVYVVDGVGDQVARSVRTAVIAVLILGGLALLVAIVVLVALAVFVGPGYEPGNP